jgi:hypothetical protein
MLQNEPTREAGKKARYIARSRTIALKWWGRHSCLPLSFRLLSFQQPTILGWSSYYELVRAYRAATPSRRCNSSCFLFSID